jgi:hypothetical protein
MKQIDQQQQTAYKVSMKQKSGSLQKINKIDKPLQI